MMDRIKIKVKKREVTGKEGVKKLRKQRKLSLESLSGLSKIDVGTLCKIEAGLYPPTLFQCLLLEKILGSEIQWLDTISGSDKAIILQYINDTSGRYPLATVLMSAKRLINKSQK